MSDSLSYIDPSQLYTEALDSYETLWNTQASLWDNFKALLDSSIALPDHEIQSPVVIAYSLANQKWAKTLPILFLYGKEGSAKTQIIKLNKALHQSTIYGVDCTFASIRNELQAMKWLEKDEERELHRDGAMLLFDNIYPDTFLRDEKLLAMMLRSYESANDVVTIAGPMGENIVFRTFTSKIMSSVQSFAPIHSLRELNRRMLTIRTKALRDMKPDELTHVPDDILDLDSINFEGLNWEYTKFWNDVIVCNSYVQNRKQLTRSNSSANKYLKSVVTEEKAKIVVDLICTGMVTGGFTSLEHGIDTFGAYFDLHAKRTAGDMPASIEIFKKFIEDYCLLRGDLAKEIPVGEIKSIADDLNDNWKAEKRISQKEITEIMASLGWTLDGPRKVWVPVIQ